ncbi:c-type cytochrome [Sphingomonas montanisoli]|nr:c-type cytochrome [Sphingomonas montanisoli]
MRFTGGMIGSMAVLLTGCDAAALRPAAADGAAIARGREAAVRLGCGACHVLPGVDWPRGRVGPALSEMGDRALIAGRLPNRPDILAHFVRDAPALLPGSAMPALPMRDRDATDIAAWLGSLHAD